MKDIKNTGGATDSDITDDAAGFARIEAAAASKREGGRGGATRAGECGVQGNAQTPRRAQMTSCKRERSERESLWMCIVRGGARERGRDTQRERQRERACAARRTRCRQAATRMAARVFRSACGGRETRGDAALAIDHIRRERERCVCVARAICQTRIFVGVADIERFDVRVACCAAVTLHGVCANVYQKDGRNTLTDPILCNLSALTCFSAQINAAAHSRSCCSSSVRRRTTVVSAARVLMYSCSLVAESEYVEGSPLYWRQFSHMM